MELTAWIAGSITRTTDIPTGKEDRAADVLLFHARSEFQEVISRAKLPSDYLTPHIDAFIAELGTEDKDWKYEFEDDDTHIRVIIENTSPATSDRQAQWMKRFLDDVLDRPRPERDEPILYVNGRKTKS